VWSLECGGLSWCWQCGVWSIIQFLGIGFQFSALGKRYWISYCGIFNQ